MEQSARIGILGTHTTISATNTHSSAIALRKMTSVYALRNAPNEVSVILDVKYNVQSLRFENVK